MANITRFGPLEDAFDELFRGFFVRPIGFETPSAGVGHFRVDVGETDNAYIVRAELPGVKKDDINVAIDEDEVSISAEVKHERDAKEGERGLRTERYYGKVHRAFSLGQPVDETTARAKYADGVLELTLPKKAATHAKRIAIQ